MSSSKENSSSIVEKESKDELRDLVERFIDAGCDDMKIFSEAKLKGFPNSKTLETLTRVRGSKWKEKLSSKKKFTEEIILTQTHEQQHILPDGITPLLYAISICDEDLALQKIDRETSNDKMEYGLTALHMASERGMIRVVKELVRQGACIDKQSSSDIRLHHTVVQSGGSSALHLATRKGHVDVVKFLLQSGANDMSRDFDMSIPLEIAMIRNDEEMIRIMSQKYKGPLNTILKNDESLKKWREQKIKHDRDLRTKRSIDAFVPLPTLQNPYKLNSVFSNEECDHILHSLFSHTSQFGWTSQRHRGHASTTDIQCSEIKKIDDWVSF